MNAVKKPVETHSEPAPQAEAPVSEANTSTPARKGRHSPVHILHDRLEAAFSRQNESKMTRIITMLLVVALSTWVAAGFLQAGA
ncbi:hypothetical protein K1X12_08760 [Hyphomonas sp. WL0036]|uniref:hypothetical protein n=1 Tax=Hyphomonas sediminis TaxID=2866160 RepID=UPI001C7E66C3|nr:hypothetical protein [Hyphomonas sediminis]MBY9066988.1 hypothetical protein [Hyphomonas sediminis]